MGLSKTMSSQTSSGAAVSPCSDGQGRSNQEAPGPQARGVELALAMHRVPKFSAPAEPINEAAKQSSAAFAVRKLMPPS